MPHLRRCCPPVLLSSYRSWNRRDRKRKCVQFVISVFRVLSGSDEARSLVTQLFPQGHNPTCHTGEFTNLNLFNVTDKFYHVTIYAVSTGIVLPFDASSIHLNLYRKEFLNFAK